MASLMAGITGRRGSTLACLNVVSVFLNIYNLQFDIFFAVSLASRNGLAPYGVNPFLETMLMGVTSVSVYRLFILGNIAPQDIILMLMYFIAWTFISRR